MKTLAAVLVLVSAAAGAGAENPEKKGYWWNKVEPAAETEAPKPEHPDLGPPPADPQLEAMYPKDVEKLIEDYRDYALWKMTPEHVSWYYRLQDFARRRSTAFMNVTEYVMLTQASMNVNTDYPENTPGLTAHATAMQQEIDGVLKAHSGDAALVMLSRQGCPYCGAQRNILRYFSQRHPDWEIREFDIDRQPEVKAKFSVDYTPTTVVIFKGGDKQWFPVSVGVDSVSGIEENVFRAIRLMKGETSPETFTLQQYQQGGVMDPTGAAR